MWGSALLNGPALAGSLDTVIDPDHPAQAPAMAGCGNRQGQAEEPLVSTFAHQLADNRLWQQARAGRTVHLQDHGTGQPC